MKGNMFACILVSARFANCECTLKVQTTRREEVDSFSAMLLLYGTLNKSYEASTKHQVKLPPCRIEQPLNIHKIATTANFAYNNYSYCAHNSTAQKFHSDKPNVPFSDRLHREFII